MQTYGVSKFSTANSTSKIVWQHESGPSLILELSSLPLVGVLCSTLVEIKNNNEILESFQLSPTANFDDGTYTIDHKHIITAISKSPCIGLKVFDGQRNELRRLQMRFIDDNTFEKVHIALLKSIYSLKSSAQREKTALSNSQPYIAKERGTRQTSSQIAPPSPGSSFFQDSSRNSNISLNTSSSQKRHRNALQLTSSRDSLHEISADPSEINSSLLDASENLQDWIMECLRDDKFIEMMERVEKTWIKLARARDCLFS